VRVFKDIRRRRQSKLEALLDKEIGSIERLMEDEDYQNSFLPKEAADRCRQNTGVDKAFEAVTYSGEEWFLLFFDINYPRKSTLLPAGFEFSGDMAMFSGFVDEASQRFPEDYNARLDDVDEQLQPAYVPVSRITTNFDEGTHVRPLAHWCKIEALAARGL